uniref:Uncharacterized protein n=1 Tax=Cajanus cajan TaxID=3821 RepID=A0A151SUD6_CAJCA|nr:hypothetical protein KK1_013812 [Cajanus cajan]
MAYQTPDQDSGSDPKTPTRLYNPYKDLEVPIRNLYHLPTSPEYLFVEEARRKRRSWGEPPPSPPAAAPSPAPLPEPPPALLTASNPSSPATPPSYASTASSTPPATLAAPGETASASSAFSTPASRAGSWRRGTPTTSGTASPPDSAPARCTAPREGCDRRRWRVPSAASWLELLLRRNRR